MEHAFASPSRSFFLFIAPARPRRLVTQACFCVNRRSQFCIISSLLEAPLDGLGFVKHGKQVHVTATVDEIDD